MSIDSPDEATHDAGRGLKNFRKAIEGLKLLHEAGFETGITRQRHRGEDAAMIGQKFRQLLRRQGLLGDTLSHAALPGIALAFLFTGSKEPIVLLLGAGVAGWIGSLLMLWIVRETVLSEDSALGIVLSTFFGFGIVLLSLIQQRNDAPSMYKEFLDSGREGLQHMSYWTRDYQALYDRALSLGYKVGHEGQIGGEKGRFAYFDTQAHPGTVVEISDISGGKGSFFEHIRKVASSWDGSDPIREVGDR